MKLKFDANQPFQLTAIQAVVKLFDGQPGPDQGVASFERDSTTSLELTEKGLANRCVLGPDLWFKNLRAVQTKNGLPESSELSLLKLTRRSRGGYASRT